MAKVINNYILNSTIIGSSVIQGNNECTVTTTNTAGALDPMCLEVLRLFMSLDLRHQAAVITYLYDMAESNPTQHG